VFLAGIMQHPFFDADVPKYVNYGSIGVIVGHEMTHGFDNMGRNFDKNGRILDWWDPDTKKKFVQKAQCFINQYDQYTEPTAGVQVRKFLQE